MFSTILETTHPWLFGLTYGYVILPSNRVFIIVLQLLTLILHSLLMRGTVGTYPILWSLEGISKMMQLLNGPPICSSSQTFSSLIDLITEYGSLTVAPSSPQNRWCPTSHQSTPQLQRIGGPKQMPLLSRVKKNTLNRNKCRHNICCFPHWQRTTPPKIEGGGTSNQM